MSEEKKNKLRRFPSGAVRGDNTGRPRPDLISPYSLLALGEHLSNNADEKGEANYLLGITEKSCCESLFRHYCELQIALLTKDVPAARLAWQGIMFNAMAGLHTHEIIRLGVYEEIYPKTELIDAP